MFNAMRRLKRKVYDVFHEHWAAAILVAVFVTWCVAMHLKLGL